MAVGGILDEGRGAVAVLAEVQEQGFPSQTQAKEKSDGAPPGGDGCRRQLLRRTTVMRKGILLCRRIAVNQPKMRFNSTDSHSATP